MKKTIITLISLFLLFLQPSKALVLVISDVDDTIKQSFVRDKTQLFRRTFLQNAPSFKHLIDIYHNLKKHYNSNGEDIRFLYLTAAPKIVNVQYWLQTNNAPEGTIIQKRNRDILENSYLFKMRVLRSYFQQFNNNNYPSKIFFFGDNGEYDPKVYSSIRKELALENTVIFIRDVYAGSTYLNKHFHEHPDFKIKVIDGIKYFISEFDLLSHSELPISQSLQEEIVFDYYTRTIIPEFVLRDVAQQVEKYNISVLSGEVDTQILNPANLWDSYFYLSTEGQTELDRALTIAKPERDINLAGKNLSDILGTFLLIQKNPDCPQKIFIRIFENRLEFFANHLQMDLWDNLTSGQRLALPGKQDLLQSGLKMSRFDNQWYRNPNQNWEWGRISNLCNTINIRHELENHSGDINTWITLKLRNFLTVYLDSTFNDARYQINCKYRKVGQYIDYKNH